ncbi:hypothetical protein [Caballeronia sordidicola]|uniref:Uncharacterized protein n=1 Tax=Caballeronia sordidicola TaxID=196367 RepID=A0A242N900_CABSO|nr:hypothetical protein [Caballeronia sordidicola]OTP80121.1 hypothetical protein PAMC26510_03945 [Caballeronia sordidicola]
MGHLCQVIHFGAIIKAARLTATEGIKENTWLPSNRFDGLTVKDSSGIIKLKFELDGNLRDPQFSLSQSLGGEILKGFPSAIASGAGGIAKWATQAVEGIGGKLGNSFSK